jgi:protein ImuB
MMLWLCLSLPQLPASALGLHESSIVVSDQRGSQRWLITAASGIAAGTALSAALAVNPNLRVHARNPQAEQDALLRLAHWIYHYGSPVICEIIDLQEAGRCPRARLWFEAGASLKLFGGLRQLRKHLFAELAELGHSAKCAVAPSRAGAALLAEAGREKACADTASLETALAGLSVDVLPWSGITLRSLQGVGLRHLGELFRLPREGFARRFGEGLLCDLDRLRGLAPEPFEAVTPPPRYARRFELSGEIETVEPLLFPLKRMCAELTAYLRARDRGACSLRLVCDHALGAPTLLTLRFLAPTRDAVRMLAALNERLLRDPPSRPVRELTMEVDEFATPQALQGDLFDNVGGQTLEWEQALERVLARFGEASLWTPACVADHRPECAFAKTTPGTRKELLPAARPAWLLPQPQLLRQRPEIIDDAELIESGWWDGADVRRRYHVALGQGGNRLWVYEDTTDGQWYLQGYWA